MDISPGLTKLLSYASDGKPDAPTLVLLHGVGTTSWMWRRLVADLAGELHVVSVDLPGHGASAQTPWTSMADTAFRVAEVVGQVAGGDRVHLVGLSLGGYVALDLAAKHSDMVASAMASGVNVMPFPRPRLMRAAGRAMSPFLSTGVMLRANARALGVPLEDFEGYATAARSMAPGTFSAVGGELMDYSLPSIANRSTSRVLALAGGDEHTLILQSLARIAAVFPYGAARVAPGVGHAWNGQKPELFAATVRAHVAGDPLPEDLVSVPAAT
jgi:pimeloyl-ACP methyl ester carboxylesterase